MKQHQWTNPLLSMLASTAMCAILSFNQPTMRSVDSNEQAYQANSFKIEHSQIEGVFGQELKHQLELALTLELFASEHKVLNTRSAKKNLNNQQNPAKQECDENTKHSAKTKLIMSMVRITNLI